MVQSNPIYTPDAAGDTIDYKPLSLMAVAGLIVAGVFLALIAISGLASLLKSEPFFLGGWAAIFPIGGAALSGLALWQIYSSEGTRAGAKLAKWGLGICIVSGLAYFTYQEFTALAIVQQANRFLMEKDEQSGFFPRLQGNETDVNTAFLLSLDIADRGVANPANPKDMERLDLPWGTSPKGRLTHFLDSPLVHLIRFAGPAGVQIEPQGVSSWDYGSGAYRIVRSYRIATADAVYELPVTVTSIEPTSAGDKRRWKVEPALPNALQLVSSTEMGFKKQAWRSKSADLVGNPRTGWLALLRGRDEMEIYLRTQPGAKRKELSAQAAAIRSGTPLAAIAGSATWPFAENIENALMAGMLPGFHTLDKASDYFKMDNMRIWDPAYLPNVKSAAKRILSNAWLPNLSFKAVPDEFAEVEVKSGEILATHFVDIRLNVVGPKNEKGEVLMGEVLLSVKIVAAAPENLDLAAPDADQQWYIKSREIVRALPIPQSK